MESEEEAKMGGRNSFSEGFESSAAAAVSQSHIKHQPPAPRPPLARASPLLATKVPVACQILPSVRQRRALRRAKQEEMPAHPHEKGDSLLETRFAPKQVFYELWFSKGLTDHTPCGSSG